MSKVKALLTLLFSAIGVFAAREFYKPRNIKELLKWRGIKLSSDESVGESMFFENQSELEAMKIESPTALGGGCNEKFKITNLSDENFNDAKKFCSDNPTTIMARIIREGEKDRVIDPNNREAFKVNYLLATSRQAVLDLVNLFEPVSVEDVGEKLSKGCKDQERVAVVKVEEKEKIANFKKRCYNLEAKNYKQLLEKEGRKLITKQEDFERKFKDEKFEHAQEFKKELLAILKEGKKINKQQLGSLFNSQHRRTQEWKNIDPEKEEDLFKVYGWRIYNIGCNDKQNTSLIGGYMERENVDNYAKFRFRCSTEN